MLKKFQKDLQKDNLDAALISSHYNIVHLTQFTGFQPSEREAYLFVTKDTSYVITDSRYTEAVKLQIPELELIEVSPTLSHFEAVAELINQHKVKNLGVEEDNLTIKEHRKIKRAKTTHYSPSKLRLIKTSSEIAAIKKACGLGDKVFEYMLTIIKPGKTEKELAWEMEKFVKDAGAELSFDPIIAFNANAAMPHHANTSDKLRATNHQLILMDFGVKVDGYCSDMTRVVFWGKALAKQKKVYQTVLTAQQKAIQYLMSHTGSGIRSSEVDKVAREYIESQGFQPFGHGLGHGIGLEVHEGPRLSPASKDVLLPGMVFSIEPGVYLPGEFGVRIEDLYTIQGKKLIQLTDASKEIIEL